MVVALNALAPVPMTGGRERFCDRGLPIRSMLFRSPTVSGYRALGHSLDLISVFEAMVDTVSWLEPWL